MDLNEARQLASRLISPLGTEQVRMEDALGRVLAEDMVADRNLPAESRSRLDGFALRSTDTLGASPTTPMVLRLVPGRIAAGHVMTTGLGSTECIRILTGAPLPPCADAVAPQEEVALEGENLILVKVYAEGSGVMLAGEDAQCGEPLVSAGAVLTPTRLALIAALGGERVAVTRQPHVALLATGDEVKALGTAAEGPYTYCNNMHLLAWLVQLQGGKSLPLGVTADDPHLIADRLQAVAADLVITTGGMGKGDRDFMLEVWSRLGVQLLVKGINLIPGKNSALGERRGQIFLALPGNPWAAQIAFEQLAALMLWRWQGLQGFGHARMAAVLQTSLTGRPGFYHAIRGSLDLGTAPPRFHPSVTRRASVFGRVKDCFAYMLLEPHVVEVAAGSEVQVQLSDFPLLASPLLKGTGLPCSD